MEMEMLKTRCKRSDGKKWRCSLYAEPYSSLCEKHLLQRRRRLSHNSNNKRHSRSESEEGQVSRDTPTENVNVSRNESDDDSEIEAEIGENSIVDSDRSVVGNKGELEEMLKEKNEELESLEQMNWKLISIQREANDEMQKAREAAMQFLKTGTHNNICVKRMGELFDEPWKIACRKKFRGKNWEMKCLEIFSLWQDHLRDALWFPFKVETHGDKHVQVVDWQDEKLIKLKESLGDEVCKSVIQALEELNEYNSSGRYPVPELWNVKENRKASISEIVEVLISKIKQKAKRRRRS